jgi:hypothetical protein
MKVSAIYLLTVGVLWVLGIALIFLAMSSIAEPVSLLYTSVYYAALLIGPALLIIGAIAVLRRSRPKLGFILVALGCIILTGTVAHQTILGLHVEPLQAKPPYRLFVILIIVTLLTDAVAWRLYRRIFRSHDQTI